nr:hypothetical protein [Microvirga sp. HBU67558]
MDADPELEAVLVGRALTGLRESLLDSDGALDGIDNAGELGQDAIPSRIGDPPAVLGDQPVHRLTVSRQGPQGSDLILLHKPRIARYVSRENGCQAPLDPVLLWTHGTLGAASEGILRRVG